MNITPQQIGIGALAGLAFALLSVGSSVVSGLTMLLFFLSPLPLLLATLSYGIVSGFIGAVVGVLSIAFYVQPQSAAIVGLTSAVPALIAGYFLSLARPADEVGGSQGMMLWYPISEVLGRVCFAIGIGFIGAGIILGYGEELTQAMTEMLAKNLNANGQSVPPEALEQLSASLFKLIPMVQPATWVIVFVGNLYLAIKIAQKTEMFSRPDDDWRLALRMPGIMMPVFCVGIIGMFLGGNLGAAAAAITGAVGAGYVIAGLGATHLRLADNPGKGIFLFGIYLALVVFLPLVVVFLIIGLFEKATSAPLSKVP